MTSLPLIDISPLLTQESTPEERDATCRALEDAARNFGFLRVSDHGLPLAPLRESAAAFFALPREEKSEIAMAKGGSAWRGWFAVGEELTSGLPDQKEGLYFGQQLGDDHPAVVAQTPLHGSNLFPRHPEELGTLVVEYMEAASAVAAAIMDGLEVGLGLEKGTMAKTLGGGEESGYDPTILFRIFHYPAGSEEGLYGVGEHTDYGVLTLLAQDDVGGLEVRAPDGTWIQVPADPDVLVVNIGDMLERISGGFFVSTPHRVRNTSDRSRISFPLFFDPAWSSRVPPIQGMPALSEDTPPNVNRTERWDNADVSGFDGEYGEYLVAKVRKVFPHLFEAAIAAPPAE